MLKLNRGEYMNIDKEINKIWSYYDNFNYQEALNICDKILNRYPYFEEILEVKAYIFYINGYLEESIVCWESNFSENNNTSAKFCLDNLKNYKELKNLYNDALIDIENKKLNNALKCYNINYDVVSIFGIKEEIKEEFYHLIEG